MVSLIFLPHNLGSLVGNSVCHSVNVNGVMIPLGSGGDTSTLHYVIEVVSTFCDLVWWEHKNLVYTALTPLHPSHCLHLPLYP